MSENKIKTGVYTNMNGEEVSFSFCPSPSMRDKIKFVKSVTETIVDDSYLYIARNMFFDFYLVSIFTNIDTSEFYGDDIDSVSMIEEFLNETTAVDIVKLNMDYGVIAELEKAVDLDIEYRTGIHRNSIEESLSNLLDTLDNKIGELDTDSMMDAISKLSSISGEFTPEKMLEAYANTDMFKNK